MPVEELTRSVQSIAATHSGSILVIDILDYTGKHLVFAITPGSGNILWQQSPKHIPTALAASPDDHTIALGLQGVGATESGVLLLDARTGQQTGALGWDEKLDFVPGQTYPRWGGGITQLVFSPDGTLLYGLSDDTLFAWDVAAKHYLWIKDVPPAVPDLPDLTDPLPYGHAATFALSPDGRQIAAARIILRVTSAGRTRPVHFIQRVGAPDKDAVMPAFSPDSKILAAGEVGSSVDGKTATYATHFWIAGSTKSVGVAGCGGGIAWTYDPDVFACQNDTGAHLRNIHDPQKDIGQAGPVSDLPILKVGNSLWVAAYKTKDWKEPAKSLPLTLVELGSGRQVTVAVPGRTASTVGAK